MILYEGKSKINGEPIVAIGVVDSNPKIGEMFCTYIIRQDRLPSVAAYDGSDDAICGECPFRAQVTWRFPDPGSRTCYVRLDDTADEKLSPDAIWHKYKAGEFGTYNPPYWYGPARRYDRVENPPRARCRSPPRKRGVRGRDIPQPAPGARKRWKVRIPSD